MSLIQWNKDWPCMSMAWPAIQVEEAECEVEDQKALTFRGKGPGPPGTKVCAGCQAIKNLPWSEQHH